MIKHIPTFGSAWGIGAPDHRCAEGPSVIQKSPFNTELLQHDGLKLDWKPLLGFASSTQPTINIIAHACSELAKNIESTVEKKQRFLNIGGDHTCAIGTWSGAHNAIKNLGLIWIDAHMDSHTPETTPSGQIHGMPLACLLGYGDTRLIRTPPALAPESVALIGVRSFEAGEAALLERLGVKIFYMPETKERGLDAVMQDAVQIVTQKTTGYGISIDLDAIDPTEAPGVGSPAPDGLSSHALYHALKPLQSDARLIGIEIAEFNPSLDKNHKTEHIIFDIINILFNT